LKLKNYRKTGILLFLFLLAGIVRAMGQEGFYFKQISVDDGLTQSTVRCILNDQRGYIWIGTKSGLNRYDRYNLKSYFYKKNDPGSIPGNQINFLCEDREGNIWVGTEHGLAIYDPNTDRFHTIKFQNHPILVRSALELPQGMIFGGAGILYQYDGSKKELLELHTSGSEKSSELFTKMVRWRNNQVLLQTRRDGAWLFKVADTTLKRATFIKDLEVLGLYVNHAEQVWISPYGKGLKRYDKDGGLIREYNSKNSGLNNDVVLDILEEDGKLWLATDGGGINILDLKSGKFSALKPIPGSPGSFPENSVLNLYHDHEDNLWAGSIRGGLISIQEASITTYRDVPLGGIHGLSHKTVLTVHEDKAGILWIGTDGGGVNRYDPKQSNFKHLLPTSGLKVTSITDFSDKELLISIFNKGIHLVDKNNGRIRPVPGITAEQASHISTSGISINVNKVSRDYIYLFADQIIRYHIPTGRLDPVPYKPRSNAYSSLLNAYSDSTQSYLFAPFAIFALNHKQNRLTAILELPGNSDPITAVACDKRGIFWIGNREGLMYYDPQKKALKKISTSLFNEVSTLVIDKQDRLWIGAQNMIFLYHARENKFVSFDESDGVLPNELFYKASVAAANGNTYLGGVKGLHEIKKTSASSTIKPPVLKLMALEVNGVPLLPKNNKATVSWNHTSLLVTVMAREKDVFRNRMFRYKITGLDSRVIETYDHALALGSLPVGNYKIMVSCNLKSGRWSNYTKILEIEVSPPWFQRWWFIGLVFVLIAAALRFTYLLAISKREQRMRWQLKEHKQRTDEAKINFLIHISHELRTPLTLIYSPLRRLLNEKNVNGEIAKILEGIYRQAGNMRNIIDMVLDLQKIELAQEQLKLESLELNDWVLNIVENFSAELDQKGIRLIYDLDQRISELVFDGKKCALVLTNLMANALKFSGPNSSITVRTSSLEGFVRLYVVDEGIGLDHVDVDQLFKQFYQGAHQEQGSGIGLSYSKTLIEMHGGRISALNNQDRGATFYFDLPVDLKPLAAAVSTAPYPLLHTPVFPTAGYSLMIVEDEPELLHFLADSLKPHFKEIIEAADGLQAQALIEKLRPDIVLSDVMMPGIDGFELCRRLKEDMYVSHTPFILLTTQGDAESRDLGYKLGADAYIAKPFELDYLQTILANLLKNRELVKSRFKSSTSSIPPKEGTFSSADEQFMLKLNQLISDNIDSKDLHVDFLTDRMAMSRATLYNKLKNIADIGVNDYINKLRLERAAYLLIHTDKSIMEIADGVGFTNQRYFSTVFKQFYNSTPSAYRSRQEQKVC
jgi:signal transduction histidine kinase/ligand-binding sensor domain-containing protein/DNA-binding response OmpR family regulator